MVVPPVGSGQSVVSNIRGQVFASRTPETFTHAADGNVSSDGRWDSTWGAESRLAKAESRWDTPAASWRRVDWQYDGPGRRIRQTTRLWKNDVWRAMEDRKLVSNPMLFGRTIADLNGTNNALRRPSV